VVLNALLDRNVDLNKQNESGETALHVAIIHEHKEIIEMLINHRDINLRLQNDQGLTPFAAALRVKNTKAAERILDKEPTTAEQFDKLGRNFLHLAINEKDTESILFLIQVKVDANSRTKVSFLILKKRILKKRILKKRILKKVNLEKSEF